MHIFLIHIAALNIIMSFNITETINNISSKVLDIKLVDTIVKNPLFLSLFCAFLIVAVVLFIFRNSKHDESTFTMGLRVGIWAAIISMATIFLSNAAAKSTNGVASYGDPNVRKNVTPGTYISPVTYSPPPAPIKYSNPTSVEFLPPKVSSQSNLASGIGMTDINQSTVSSTENEKIAQ